MTALADRWGTPPQQFWLRGEMPDHPIRYDEQRDMWNVYGHQEALEIIGDPGRFSSDATGQLPVDVDPAVFEGDLTVMDPPRHRKLRTLVSRAFTPKTVADLEPRISELTHELLDAVTGRGRLELVADLANPLPVTVIAELLGVPSGDRALFTEFAETMVAGTGLLEQRADGVEGADDALRAHGEQLQRMRDYLREHAEERRRRPREDLLTRLVEADVDGERLTGNEIVNFANLLLAAGHITTTMLLGNTVACLDAHPEQAARVRADRQAVPAVIEESLRFLTPFAVTARTTTAEVEIAGRRVPPDRLVMVWIGAANRDERVFARPAVFDPARDPNPHLAFGRGIHFCLGAPLARLEGRIAMNILLDRFPRLRTDPDDPPEFIPNPELTGVRRLPLVW
jgi:cytochrome P450